MHEEHDDKHGLRARDGHHESPAGMHRNMRTPEVEIREEGAHRQDAKRGKHQQILANAAMIEFIMAVVTSFLVILVRGRMIAHRADLRMFSLARQRLNACPLSVRMYV